VANSNTPTSSSPTTAPASAPAATPNGAPAVASSDAHAETASRREQVFRGMACLDTSNNPRIPQLMKMVGAVSRARTPQEVLLTFGQGMQELSPTDGYISISTRNCAPGEYRITRMYVDDEQLRFDPKESDPWHHGDQLAVQTGGFFGEIIRSAYPEVIHHLAIHDDLVIGDALSGFGSMMAVPLFDGGEPMIRKDLHEHVAYATQRGIRRVSINTNGTMLVAKRRQELIEAGLSHMEVSIDASTADTYLKIRRSPLFDRVVDNTLAYIEESKAHDPENQVTVSFVLQSDNRHEEQAFRDFWEPKVDRVYIREYHQHNDWVDDHGLFKKRGNPHRHPCPFLWNRLIVFHDGRVRFCEFDWRADHPIGDVRTQTLKEIWHSDAFRALRQQHVCGTFDHPFCKSCTDWRQVHWTGLGDDRTDNIVEAA